MFSLEKNHKEHEVIESDRIDPAYNAKILKEYVYKKEN